MPSNARRGSSSITRRLEQRADGAAVVDASDRLRAEGSDGEDLDLRGRRGDRVGVGDEQALEPRGAEPLDGVAGEHRMHDGGRHAARALREQEVGRAEDGPARGYLVVDDEAAL